MHGHGHPTPWIEIGYALSSKDLSQSDKTLRQQAYIAKSTVRNLAVQKGVDFPELIRGSSSLGGLLYRWYRSVPSPADPSPKGKAYFIGGYIVRTHGSRNGGTIDATQLEHYGAQRATSSARQAYAAVLARALHQFFRRYYAIDLASGSRLLGPGCPGTQGTPAYRALGSIAVGQPARLEFSRLPAMSPNFLLLGISSTSFGAVSLPLHLASLGARNCYLRQSLDLILPLGAASQGSIRLDLPIPLLASLKGRGLYSSALVIDLKANKLGLILSNALTWKIGQL
jgi:hypothetical protein